jgi:adenylosuccinate lyase
MIHNIKTALGLAAQAFTLGLRPSVYAQETMKQAGKAKTLETGTFHGKVHNTSGHATIYKTVSIYCERFNANFGAAPLKKF